MCYKPWVLFRCLKRAYLTTLPEAQIAYSVHGRMRAQCLTTDWMTGVRSPTEAEDLSSNLCVQTGCGAHLASCTMGTGGSLPGGKARPGLDADDSPTSNAEVKKE
jgi:hypothetical protein